MSDYQRIAKIIANKLTKSELIELSELLDVDSDHSFNDAIDAETMKVAPELFEDYITPSKK